MVDDDNTKLIAVAGAIQDFINSINEQSALLDNAVVIWEEVGVNDFGETTRRVRYTIPTDNFTMSGTLGLLEAGAVFVRRDILGDEE